MPTPTSSPICTQPPHNCGACEQSEKNSGGQHARYHAPTARDNGIDVAAKDRFLDNRSDEYGHQQEKERGAAILEQRLHRHLRLAGKREGCQLYQRSDQESGRNKAEVPQGARQLARPQCVPADGAPERCAKAPANLCSQIAEQKKKQQQLMHDGEETGLARRCAKLGGLHAERCKNPGEQGAQQNASGQREHGQ